MWRQVSWSDPTDPTVYASCTVSLVRESFTFSSAVVAFGKAIRLVPEFCRVIRGMDAYSATEHVDVLVPVRVSVGGLRSIRFALIRDADTKQTSEVSEELMDFASQVRKDPTFEKPRARDSRGVPPFVVSNVGSLHQKSVLRDVRIYAPLALGRSVTLSVGLREERNLPIGLAFDHRIADAEAAIDLLEKIETNINLLV